MVPELPVDVYEEILAEDALSDADLADVCLVGSQDLLRIARRHLYRGVRLDFVRTAWGTYKRPTGVWRHRKDLLKAESVLAHDHLAALVECVWSNDSGVGSQQSTTDNLREQRHVWDQLLSACGQLSCLRVTRNSSDYVFESLAAAQHQFNDVGSLPLLTSGLEFLKTQKNLRRLSCSTFSVHSHQDIGDVLAVPSPAEPFTAQLQVLVIEAPSVRMSRPLLDYITASSRESLTRLRLDFDPSVISDLSMFPNLEHLTLQVELYASRTSNRPLILRDRIPSELPSMLRSCAPTLRRFSIFSFADEDISFMAHLCIMRSLPKSLRRFDLDGEFDLVRFGNLLSPETPPFLRVIRCLNTMQTTEQRLKVVQWCEQHGFRAVDSGFLSRSW
ncbi:hypothetical protein JCM10449v2_001629 [Rhodotorula kratochvilovae]